MKTILLIGAMEEEIRLFKERFNIINTDIIDGYEFYILNINNNNVILCKSLIMSINSILSTYIAIKKYNPDIIILQGCAGAYLEKIHTGDIVISTDIININEYYTKYKEKNKGSNSLDWELVNFECNNALYSKPKYVYSSNYLINIAKKTDYNYGRKYFGTTGCGDCWNNEIDRINYLNKKYNILCEDMESYGITFIANKYNIKVITIKVISNNIINQEKYQKNVLNNCQEFIINFINNIN